MTATKNTKKVHEIDGAEFKKALKAMKARPAYDVFDTVSARGTEWMVKAISTDAAYGIVYTLTHLGERSDFLAIESPTRSEIDGLVRASRPRLNGELSELAKVRNHEVAMFNQDRKRAK